MVYAALSGGILSFVAAILCGHKVGIWHYNRKFQWRGFVNYFLEFMLAVLVGFAIQAAAWWLGGLTGFLPDWLGLLLYAALLGAAFGFLLGFKLGYARVRRGNSNCEVSTAPSILGAVAGMAAYVLIF